MFERCVVPIGARGFGNIRGGYNDAVASVPSLMNSMPQYKGGYSLQLSSVDCRRPALLLSLLRLPLGPLFFHSFMSLFSLTLAGLGSWFHLLRNDSMQHDLVRLLLGVLLEALAPIVADCVRKHSTLAIEAGSGDRTANIWIALETMLGLAVPEVECTVRASSAERAMLRMEGDGIDGIDIGLIFVVGRGLSMALEREVVRGVAFFDVLNCAATFDTADREAVVVGCEAGDHAGLKFQWRLNGLVECVGLVEVDDIEVTVGRAHNQELALCIHGVDALLTIDRRGRLVAAEIPIFDCLVPRGCDENGCVVDVGEGTATDRLVVGGEGLRCHVARSNVEQAEGLVSADANTFGTVLRPSAIESRCFEVNGGLYTVSMSK